MSSIALRASSTHCTPEMKNMATNEEFLTAKKEMSKRYLSKATPQAFTTFAAAAPLNAAQNIVGVGVGNKITDEGETNQRCIRFYVAQKIHKDSLNAKQMIPPTIDGLPTDVIVSGRFRMFGTAENNKLKKRPIQPGTSIGFAFPPPRNNFVMAGTFGAIATKNGKRYILSNNHVLAENGRIAIGASIFQPGLLDGGNSATDKVAKLSEFVEIKPTGLNRVDCALAEIAAGISVNARHMPSVGKLSSTAPVAAADGMLVMKTGRTTGHTRGKVVDVAADVNVGFEDKDGVEFVATFADQILIVGQPGSFSDGGDSGSLIVDRATKRATGLLFAGSASHTIGNHIADVLAALGVTLETAR